jgi:solute carrier family 25 phosphate transporter 3
MTPLDVVKCNMQVDPRKYHGLFEGIRTVLTEEGAAGLVKGWGPTAVGYSLQGAGKFGLYEYFKDAYSTLLGEERTYQYRGPVYVAASASAEFFADILLCPFEMIKVKCVDCGIMEVVNVCAKCTLVIP